MISCNAQGMWRASIDAPSVNLRTGILAFEYEGPQSVSITVDLFFPAHEIVAPESIADVVDYDRIARAVADLESAAHTPLLENIAIRLINVCFADVRIAAARVALSKNDIYPTARPTVELSLARDEWFFLYAPIRPAQVGLVVAHDRNRIIGDAATNRIPWSVPSDTRHWTQLAADRIVIAGRRTAESLLAAGEFVGQRMIVVSSSRPRMPPSPAGYCSFAATLGAALSFSGNGKVMIIGGEQVFAEALERDIVDTLWVTEIDADVAARVKTPVRFPELPRWRFRPCGHTPLPSDPLDEFAGRIATLIRA